MRAACFDYAQRQIAEEVDLPVAAHWVSCDKMSTVPIGRLTRAFQPPGHQTDCFVCCNVTIGLVLMTGDVRAAEQGPQLAGQP